MTRRNVLQLFPSAALAAQAMPPAIGRVQPRPSKEIAESRISAGFETLDRNMFDPERCYPYLARSGAKWARCQTGWARTERTRGQYDFAWLDAVVDRLRSIGIQPWFNLGFGNRLYIPGMPHEWASGWPPVHTPDALEAWVRYTRAVAAHFAGRVKHWEIWNEPNSSFWYPKGPNPDEYMKLVKVTVPEIRKRVPGAVIVGGALGSFMKITGVMDFLERCLQLGLADFMDKLSYHPYSAMPETNAESIVRTLRGMLARYKPGIALWQGENGAPSRPGSAGNLVNLPWTEERQAKWLLRRILTDLKLNLELTSYFHTVDMANYITAKGASSNINPKGLLSVPDYKPKASYFAYQCLCALFDSETLPADLLLHFTAPPEGERPPIESLHWATFVRRGRPIYAYWLPAGLLDGFKPTQASVLLWSGPTAPLADPVLIDPLSSNVYRLDPAERKGGFCRMEAVPIRDYPLLITDRAVALPAGGAPQAG